MAWYYGKFSCGCEGRVDIIGPGSQREWKIERAFSKKCESCFLKELEENRKLENEKAKELTNEMELPKLTGSEKQVNWANTIRVNIIEKFEKLKESEKEQIIDYCWKIKNEDDLNEAFDFIITNKTKASYYIDSRNRSIFSIIEIELPNLAFTKEEKLEKIRLEEVIKEGTVAPKEVLYPEVVYIEIEGNRIKAMYQKNDDFINLVKDLRFKWEDCWTRRINKYNGPIEDRTAELGSYLLNAGFMICIKDEEIRNMAIEGTYKEEITRWIIKDDKDIRILWKGKNDCLYRAAKKIKSAKWNNGIDVKPGNYNAIREFARLYKFKIEEEANMLLSKYEEEESNIIRVSPKKVENEVIGDGLKDVLKSSREVLSDLMEEED